MQKEQLEHLIRAAAEITQEYEFIVIGSQSILGSMDSPPAECLVSKEADIYPMNAEYLSDLIDGTIGEGSMFHERFDYYAQGVDSSTAILPEGWKNRLVRMQTQGTNGRVAYCLDPTDLFLSKCVAHREKDVIFNTALLRTGIVKVDAAIKLADTLPIDESRKVLVKSFIGRLQLALQSEKENMDKSLAEAEVIANEIGEYGKAIDGKLYMGVVKGVTDFHVVQNLGRSAVIHRKADLDRVPNQNEMVNIKYSGGRGSVEPRKVNTPSLGR